MSDKLLRAVRRAFDDAIAASPGNELLKERRARLGRAAKDLSALRSRLAELEAAMREPVSDQGRAKDLTLARDRLLADIRDLELER
jgi:hypothetical protein